jgi:hypothetical protein
MREPLDRAEAQATGIHNRGVILLIDNHDIGAADQRGDGAKIGLVAGGEDYPSRLAKENRQFLLQQIVQLEITVEEA